MKRILRPLLLLTALAALMSVSAFAAAGSGFYDVGTAAGVTVTPMTADSAAAQKLTVCWGSDNTAAPSTLYSDSVKLNVTIANAKKDCNYLVMLTDGENLPTQDDALLYINQKTQSDGTLVFDGNNAVYPMQLVTAPGGTKTVYLHITSDDPAFEAKVIPMSYTFQQDYVEPAFKLGDVDNDGSIKTGDATLILKHIAKMLTLEGTQIQAADCDRDGSIKTGDATLVLRHIAKLIDLSEY